MSFDELYKTLDQVSDTDKKEKEDKCCGNIQNYLYTESEIKCKTCGSIIDDILHFYKQNLLPVIMANILGLMLL